MQAGIHRFENSEKQDNDKNSLPTTKHSLEGSNKLIIHFQKEMNSSDYDGQKVDGIFSIFHSNFELIIIEEESSPKIR